MKLILNKPKKALKPLLKQKPLRSEIDNFKTNLIALLGKIDIIEKQPKDETEEHLKNNIRDFLRDTYYKDTNAINTKDKKDLVIHLTKETSSEVGVIIEAKRPTNINEMISEKNANKKALHELILYYLNERITNNNNELKQLVITNIYEWFIIDANVFDKVIYKHCKKLYDTKQNDKKDNTWFYTELATLINKTDAELPCVYFNIKDYQKVLENDSKTDDKELIDLYKILSPLYLLKVAANNDSNKLDKPFYNELLHIIGLEEVKEGSKYIIRRKQTDVNKASFIEMAINKLKTKGIHKVKDVSNYGDTTDEKHFAIALELCITWINRILFLKLLEGQLLNYHKGNKDYCFLNTKTIHDFDELFKLFHQVLAININDRDAHIQAKYKLVPYLNSSLFEISELEDETITIDSLDNTEILAFSSNTVLKEYKKKAKGLASLEYLFQFLNAYDFASEGEEEIQEENKTIINASVLGTVFEKINGYKDGSIYTPAFITMYMCRQSIRLAVIDKFNEVKGWNVKDFIELGNKIDNSNRTEANKIINNLKICDPAVGSGHFLVSALNELIAIKSELNILMDEQGKTLNDYEIKINNDELIITDENDKPFAYNPLSKVSNRVQKTLFNEKRELIENCLFGVDINPNSVKICRLRLWIELLKNAYYKAETNYTELETLPNIDINIKCGNSLLSRFTLDVNLKDAFAKAKYSVSIYKATIETYKNLKSKEEKDKLIHFIKELKEQLVTTVYQRDPLRKKISDLRGQLMLLDNNVDLFGAKKKTEKELTTQRKKLKETLDKKEQELAEKENSKLYKNAFEWRFEFPEVLNDKGDFEGFDLIIGNPPYIKEYDSKKAFDGLRDRECYQGKMDIWYLFGELGIALLKPNCNLCYIATNNWTTNSGASKFRNYVLNKTKITNLIDFGAYMVFDNASIQTMIMLFNKAKEQDNYTFDYRKLQATKPTLLNALELLQGNTTSSTSFILNPTISKALLQNQPFTFNTNTNDDLLNKIKSKQNFTLREKPDTKNKIFAELAQGIVPNPDVVNNSNLTKISASKIKEFNIKVGDGVFVVEKGYFNKLDKAELKYVKPLYEPYLIEKFVVNDYDKEIIYMTKKNYKKDAKNLIKHLQKFQEIMNERRENLQNKLEFNHLHWAREEYFFDKGEKILSVRKCQEPTFAYTENPAYVMMAFNIIRSNRINLKYLTGLLNSKLVAFWLRKKGKMQGNAYQIDKEPLLQIPIHKPTEATQTKLANIVDKIITAKQQNQSTTALEKQIDEMVYELYGLTNEEIKTVEQN